MGQKVNPHGIRLGITKQWSSRWFAEGTDYAAMLIGDIKAREFLEERLADAGISHIDIERPARNAKITIYAARPGVIIGKSGRDVETLRHEVSKRMGGVPVHINIEEVRKPDADSTLVAQTIAQQLEKRISFRRAMKRSMSSAQRAGAKGIKVSISGRLGGAEIARTEWAREGRVPLHTFRANIDYGTAEALTTYGIIGIKVWIYKGDAGEPEQPAAAAPQHQHPGKKPGTKKPRDEQQGRQA